MDLTAIIIAMSIPSAITGFCFWCLEKRIDKRNKELDEKEAAREENEILMVKSIGAAIALGEAAALALKNGHTNGETEAALEYARNIKHEQKEFLQRQAIDHLY
ncbi:serine/threonine protein kinase [Enterocloster clostridioformis]